MVLQCVNRRFSHFNPLHLMSPCVATSFGIALPAWIVDQKNSMLVYIY